MTGKQDGRRTRHAHRRRELVRAATDYVAAHGFEDLSMRPLAEAIGVSHATLLHHFGSKDGLFSEILHELRERDRAFIAAQAERLGGASVSAMVGSAWRRLSAPSHHGYWRLVFQAYGLAVADPDRYHRFLDGAVTDWLQLNEAVLARADYPPPRRTALATLITGAFRGILLDLLVTGDRTRTGQAIKLLATTVGNQLEAVPRVEP